MNESISVIIISYNCKLYVEDCIKSIVITCYEFIPEIIVVDNNSSDGTVEYISELYPDVSIIVNNKNVGYAAAINLGVANSSGDYLILSNADVIFKKNTIFGLIEKLKLNKGIGIVGPQQLFNDGTFQRSYGYFPSIKRGLFDLFGISKLFQSIKERNYLRSENKDYCVEYLDGAVLATKRSIFNKLEGFSEDYFFYSEEVDFCYRNIESGKLNVLVPNFTVTHHRGGSQENSGMNEKSIVMLVKSEALFLDKHSTPSKKYAYLKLENVFFNLLSFYYSIMNNKNKSDDSKKYSNAIKRVLNEK